MSPSDALGDTENTRNNYRDFGPVAELAREFVQERDNACAQLEVLRAKQPDLRLPRDWASSFFRITHVEQEPSHEERQARAEERAARRKAKQEQQEQLRAARLELRKAKQRVREIAEN